MAMLDKVHADFLNCPACEGKGKVPSRLPARTRPCDQCGGRGIVPPLRRQELLAKLAKAPKGPS
jgi:DnaJ-class molecular chaperone